MRAKVSQTVQMTLAQTVINGCEVLMSIAVNKGEREPTLTLRTVCKKDPAPDGLGIQPDLQLVPVGQPGRNANSDRDRLVSREFTWKDYLEPRKWHKPYAEALLELDSNKLAALIALAESAILNRYLELQIFPAPIEEGRDLASAVRVLSQLRKSEAIV
jgi:hypothetical protein